jgi:rubredoxin
LAGGILVVCRNCGYIFDYQYLDGKSAGKRYNGPPHVSRIIDINKTCPVCGAPLMPPDPNDPKSVVVIPTKIFRNHFRILGKKEESSDGIYKVKPFILCRKKEENCLNNILRRFSAGLGENGILGSLLTHQSQENIANNTESMTV